MENKTFKVKEMENWPETVRLEMIEISKLYSNPETYQFGYYDGYQLLYKYYERLKADNAKLLHALKLADDILETYNHSSSKAGITISDLLFEMNK